MNKIPEKFAIEFLIRNGHKLEEKNNNFARQVMKLAIEALKKQMPKKIEVQEGTNYTDGEPYNILACAKCDCEISDAFEWEDIDDDEKIKKFAEGIETEYFQFCVNCGQKLDWSVEDE